MLSITLSIIMSSPECFLNELMYYEQYIVVFQGNKFEGKNTDTWVLLEYHTLNAYNELHI